MRIGDGGLRILACLHETTLPTTLISTSPVHSVHSVHSHVPLCFVLPARPHLWSCGSCRQRARAHVHPYVALVVLFVQRCPVRGGTVIAPSVAQTTVRSVEPCLTVCECRYCIHTHIFTPHITHAYLRRGCSAARGAAAGKKP